MPFYVQFIQSSANKLFCLVYSFATVQCQVPVHPSASEWTLILFIITEVRLNLRVFDCPVTGGWQGGAERMSVVPPGRRPHCSRSSLPRQDTNPPQTPFICKDWSGSLTKTSMALNSALQWLRC